VTDTVRPGQRYDVIIDAKEAVDNYWFRVTTGGGQCDAPNEKSDDKGSIFRYAGSSNGDPKSSASAMGSGCTQETNIVPYFAIDPAAPKNPPQELDISLDVGKTALWKVNGSSMDIDWSKPTLQYIQAGTYSLPASDNGITITGSDSDWTYWLIQNQTPVPHPIHLHGHDFAVVATGSGSGAGAQLNLQNPIRRDTQSVDASGYMVIAFRTDNPGVWLLHCHIAFHISGGLGIQFLERPTEIVKSLGDLSSLTDGCKAWDTYQKSGKAVAQPDSGL
jgi:FtsP/CotA-like multicopper oxidase with cupredoxin domain